MNVGIITQARTTSTRLPNKVLMNIGNKPLLYYHIERLRKAVYPIFVATTTNETDNSIVEFVVKQQIPYYRGDENNVLSRYYECAKKNSLDIIVRVTSDCPLIDGLLVKQGIETYLKRENSNLYLSNVIERTYPRGFDFEIFSMDLLEDAHKNAGLEADLEHVTGYIINNRSGSVSFEHIKQLSDNSNYRITVDTIEDFNLIKALIEKYQAHKLNHEEIIGILDEHPELVAINAHIKQKHA